MQKSNINTYVLLIFVFCTFAALSYTIYHLSRYVPLHDWDESIYAQVAKEWSQNPSLTLHYNGIAWFEKPPVPFALMGLLIQIFANSIFPLRLVSALWGTLSVLAVFLLAQKLTRRWSIGLLASSIYLTSGYLIDRSILINVDIYLTLAWLVYLLSEKQGWRLISIVLGVGSKSLLGFIPLCVDFIFSLISRTLTFPKLKQYGLQVFVGLVWHLIMTLRYGTVFVQSHFLDHLIMRVTKPIELHFGDKLFYFTKIWIDLSIYSLFAIFGLGSIAVYVIRNRQKLTHKESSVTLRLLCNFIFVPIGYLALITLSKAKLHWYVTPLIPFVAIAAAFAINWFGKHIPYKMMYGIIFIVCIWNIILFSQHALFIDLSTYSIPEKTNLALCVKSHIGPQTSVTYIVSPQERIDTQVIEAAQLQIGSSFVYGSAPAFRYYVDAPVRYIYEFSHIGDALVKSGVVVMSSADFSHETLMPAIYKRLGSAQLPKPICKTETKVAIKLP